MQLNYTGEVIVPEQMGDVGLLWWLLPTGLKVFDMQSSGGHREQVHILGRNIVLVFEVDIFPFLLGGVLLKSVNFAASKHKDLILVLDSLLKGASTLHP